MIFIQRTNQGAACHNQKLPADRTPTWDLASISVRVGWFPASSEGSLAMAFKVAQKRTMR